MKFKLQFGEFFLLKKIYELGIYLHTEQEKRELSILFRCLNVLTMNI